MLKIRFIVISVEALFRSFFAYQQHFLKRSNTVIMSKTCCYVIMRTIAALLLINVIATTNAAPPVDAVPVTDSENEVAESNNEAVAYYVKNPQIAPRATDQIQQQQLVEGAYEYETAHLIPTAATKLALQELEKLPSRIITAYDDKQNQGAKALNLEPIVDNLREEDKYGNTGDRFYPIGRAIVTGYESFANALIKLINFPGEAFKNLNRNANVKLNQIGGRLVGLA